MDSLIRLFAEFKVRVNYLNGLKASILAQNIIKRCRCLYTLKNLILSGCIAQELQIIKLISVMIYPIISLLLGVLQSGTLFEKIIDNYEVIH